MLSEYANTDFLRSNSLLPRVCLLPGSILWGELVSSMLKRPIGYRPGTVPPPLDRSTLMLPDCLLLVPETKPPPTPVPIQPDV